MLIERHYFMKNTDTNQKIRTDFLRASYCALFGTCPDEEFINQFIFETNENGRQKS